MRYWRGFIDSYKAEISQLQGAIDGNFDGS